MVHPRNVVIVGANLTGGAAATTLRTEAFDGPVTLIGAEPHPPYERPPLSKEYLRGEVTAESTLLHPASWYGENDVELRLGQRARRIDPQGRFVELDGGERVPFDAALVATGGENRRLSIPGHELEGVFELRTLEDGDRIRDAARRGGKAVIIGAGFIGCEVAASIRTLGVEVEVVEPLAGPMVRALGGELSRVYEGIHRDHGVRFHFGDAPERFEGTERVERVVTSQGARIECDLVVVGVGIQPATAVVEGTGVLVENGVVVDELCRTNVGGIYAAGDVANHFHPLFGRRIRVEHWDNALKQGAAAAASIMGGTVPFDHPHWFWSDQYEYNLQYMGHAAEWDELVVRGSLEARDFIAFYVKDGVVLAAVGLNRGKDVRRSAGLIRSRWPVDVAALRDEDVDLKKLGAELERARGA